jgi:hypothetical protein
LFTNAEWPSFLPGNRDEFSIAAEQSNANIINLAWSPLGVGKYRRSVLTVLTSNLVLSLWEPLGLKKQWTRVRIINHTYWPQPEHSRDPKDHGYRKTNIRSFAWCDSFKASDSTDPSALPAHESRWGASLLTVVNDLNEISVIQVRRANSVYMSSKSYGLKILATHSLGNQELNNTLIYSGSLFARAFKEQQRTTSLSYGPWLSSPKQTSGDIDCAIATLAAVCGTQLRFIKLTAMCESSTQNKIQQCKLSARLEQHPLELSNEAWANRHVTGPIGWLHTVCLVSHASNSILFLANRLLQKSSASISLAVGIMAGFVAITMSSASYTTDGTDVDALRVCEWPIFEPENEDKPYRKERHLEPISSMSCTLAQPPQSTTDVISGLLATKDERSDNCRLHLGTLGGVGLTAELSKIQNENALQQPQWKRMIEDFEEKYDSDYDLGGMLVSRIWGLATCRNITAAIFVNHPTDMVEYRVASDDSATIVFSEEFGRIADTRAVFAPRALNGQALDHDQVGEMVRFVLPGADGDVELDEESQRLIYVVACRAIVGESDKSLRAHTQRSLERLAIVTGADLTEEISKCKLSPSLVAAKSIDHVNGPGGHLYEKCEVCEAGIGWCSVTHARCANGHIWRKSTSDP